MTGAMNVPASVGGRLQDGGTNTSAGPVAGGHQDRREVERCGTCGHTANDHAEKFMGASIGDRAYCHVDDHSCYASASWVLSPRAFVAASPVSDTEEVAGGA